MCSFPQYVFVAHLDQLLCPSIFTTNKTVVSPIGHRVSTGVTHSHPGSPMHPYPVHNFVRWSAHRYPARRAGTPTAVCALT